MAEGRGNFQRKTATQVRERAERGLWNRKACCWWKPSPGELMAAHARQGLYPEPLPRELLSLEGMLESACLCF